MTGTAGGKAGAAGFGASAAVTGLGFGVTTSAAVFFFVAERRFGRGRERHAFFFTGAGAGLGASSTDETAGAGATGAACAPSSGRAPGAAIGAPPGSATGPPADGKAPGGVKAPASSARAAAGKTPATSTATHQLRTLFMPRILPQPDDENMSRLDGFRAMGYAIAVRELLIYDGEAAARPAFAARVARVFAEHLAKNGLRLTGQRRAILDMLIASDRHLSQEEIHRALRGRGVGRATVFRTLKTLQECGLAAPVVGLDGVSRFEINLERPHHDHLICVECGHIREVRWPRLEKIQEEACRRVGFTPRWHRHEVFGLCRDCARKARL